MIQYTCVVFGEFENQEQLNTFIQQVATLRTITVPNDSRYSALINLQDGFGESELLTCSSLFHFGLFHPLMSFSFVGKFSCPMDDRLQDTVSDALMG